MVKLTDKQRSRSSRLHKIFAHAKILSAVGLIGAFGIISGALLATSAKDAYATNTANLDISASVSEALALALYAKDGSSITNLALDIDPSATGTFASDYFNARVSTNNATGYNLYIKAIGEDHSGNLTGDLIHASASAAAHNVISSLSAPITITGGDFSTFTNDTWGYAVDPTISSSTVTAGTFNPVPTANTVIKSHSEPIDADITAVAIGAKVDHDVISGVYSNTLEFTAVANSVPYTYTVVFDGNGGTFSPKQNNVQGQANVHTLTGTSAWNCTPQDSNTKLSCTGTIYDDRHPTVTFNEILTAYDLT
ncbi:hypothetical protein IJH74_00780, partial [Candidatus Saccharibacteria bacterium]|nr:hypothetical protein [Candidatus Saccharibacteria bacterium]